MKIINPATEEVIQEIPEDSREQTEAKYQDLRQAQPAWAARPMEERIACLQRFSDLLELEKSELAKLLTAEVGKPVEESLSELSGVASQIAYYAEQVPLILAEQQVHEVDGTEERLNFDALGVIANISAWNYPYNIGVKIWAPALMAGNALLYKPSEYATLTGREVERLMWKAGVPENIFTMVAGGAEQGQYLVELPLDGYFFTGSYQTGRAIAEAVAHKLVPVNLELGGKDPLYVADDVENIEQVAAAAVEGCYYNNGQSCCAVERIYVHEKIYVSFEKAFVKAVQKLESGQTQGPMTRHQQLKVLEQQIKDAVAKGARLVCGGQAVGEKGFYFQPTVLVDATHDMTVMKEESFGPVIGLVKVADDAEAIRLMNDTDYGLTAAVYSKSEARARNILDQVDAGTVYWNCCDRVSPYLPWSGHKNSGLGATGSTLGIQSFVKPKAYMLKRQ